MKIKIVNDKIQEDTELFRIAAVPPDIPDGHIRCTADVIIGDDDGKLLHKSLAMFILFTIMLWFL